VGGSLTAGWWGSPIIAKIPRLVVLYGEECATKARCTQRRAPRWRPGTSATGHVRPDQIRAEAENAFMVASRWADTSVELCSGRERIAFILSGTGFRSVSWVDLRTSRVRVWSMLIPLTAMTALLCCAYGPYVLACMMPIWRPNRD
jgi:hypothetical protein